MFTKDLAKLNAMASFTLKTWEGRAQKNKHYIDYNGDVAELVYATDLKSVAHWD